MSAYEQKVETWDKRYQYLLVAAEPYEVIAFKVPNMEIDKSRERFFTHWEPDKKVFTLQLHFKSGERATAGGPGGGTGGTRPLRRGACRRHRRRGRYRRGSHLPRAPSACRRPRPRKARDGVLLGFLVSSAECIEPFEHRILPIRHDDLRVRSPARDYACSLRSISFVRPRPSARSTSTRPSSGQWRLAAPSPCASTLDERFRTPSSRRLDARSTVRARSAASISHAPRLDTTAPRSSSAPPPPALFCCTRACTRCRVSPPLSLPVSLGSGRRGDSGCW